MKKLWILLAASMTILAACGNDEKADEGTKATTQQTTETEATTETEETTDATDDAATNKTEEQTAATDDAEDDADDAKAEEETTEQATSTETTSKEEQATEQTATTEKATTTDLTKPASLKESATDNTFVLYDAMDTEFMVKRIDYSYKDNGPQAKMILLNLYDQFYKTYFNGYAISKDEKTITLDLKESGLTKNNFGASPENNIELLTSLFVNFPKTETIQFKLDGEKAELDNFTTTTRSEWKKMIETGSYTYNVIED